MLGKQILKAVKKKRKIKVIRQCEASECGLACLSMIAQYYQRSGRMVDLRHLVPNSSRGLSFRALAEVAKKIGLDARFYQVGVKHLVQVNTPAILHWQNNHFVILTNYSQKKGKFIADIIDPARGRRSIDSDLVSKRSSGYVMELFPMKGSIASANSSRYFYLWNLLPASGITSKLAKTFLLSLSLQMSILTSPLLIRSLLVTHAGNAESGRVWITFALFGSLAITGILSETYRSRALITLTANLNFEMASALVSRMLHLPTVWFERRQVGSLLSRVQAVRILRELFGHSLISSTVDVFMIFGTVTALFILSPKLALLNIGLLALSCIYRLKRSGVTNEIDADVAEALSSEQTHLIESIRGIHTIRILGAEALRVASWRQKWIAAVNNQAKLEAVFARTQLFMSAFSNLETITVLGLLIYALETKQTDLPTTFSFLAYRVLLIDRVGRLIDSLVKWHSLEVHGALIQDVMENPIDQSFRKHQNCIRDASVTPPYDESAGLSLSAYDVAFKHGLDKSLFEHLSFHLASGDFVAIAGPSGCGKTTLLKILLGLLTPSTGNIAIEGVDLQSYGISRFRAEAGVVMQDDNLFSGTITQNISFFEPNPSMEWLHECAHLSAIDDDIRRMTMGYQTLIGDMGSGLSGGQKQRLLLARALYRRPRILLMDEGTSHLDTAVEKRINAAICSLRITRLIIAHRKESLDAADRIITLDSFKG